MSKLEENFKKVEQLVAYCLKHFPETRENDKELIMKVWEIQGFRLPRNLIPLFYKVALPETITRCRRKIQSEGLFLPDSERVAERSLFCMETREFFRKKSSFQKRRGGEKFGQV